MDERPTVLYICHSGTKGMKWGIRKYQNPDGSLTPAGRIRYGKGKARKKSVTKSGKPVVTSTKSEVSESEDEAKPRKKSLADMNDDELKEQINRLKLEKEYKSLVKEINPQKEKKAQKVISEIATASVKNIGTQAVTYAMGAAINKVCRGVFDINYDIVNPRQGQSGPSNQQQQRRN